MVLVQLIQNLPSSKMMGERERAQDCTAVGRIPQVLGAQRAYGVECVEIKYNGTYHLLHCIKAFGPSSQVVKLQKIQGNANHWIWVLPDDL